MITVNGKCGIKATILADSISPAGNRITTFEVDYSRTVHAELMTHRVFSRNAASSRAIPFAKMVQQLTGIPVRFGKNVAGMQDDGPHDALIYVAGEAYTPEAAWRGAKEDAVKWAKGYSDAGYHKQISGRLTECFQMMRTVITATEWGNWEWLRIDGSADPTIAELARVMKEARDKSKPDLLQPGEYHLPYVDWFRDGGKQMFYITHIPDDLSLPVVRTYLTLEQAIKVSCARAAAVSYRKNDYDLAKSLEVYDRLVGGEKKHSSALEHAASVMQEMKLEKVNDPRYPTTWEHGVSHVDRQFSMWSGNIKGFVQHRKTIPGENYD